MPSNSDDVSLSTCSASESCLSCLGGPVGSTGTDGNKSLDTRPNLCLLGFRVVSTF
jgi:hypothetical protein